MHLQPRAHGNVLGGPNRPLEPWSLRRSLLLPLRLRALLPMGTTLALGHDLPQDRNTLGFEPLESVRFVARRANNPALLVHLEDRRQMCRDEALHPEEFQSVSVARRVIAFVGRDRLGKLAVKVDASLEHRFELSRVA